MLPRTTVLMFWEYPESRIQDMPQSLLPLKKTLKYFKLLLYETGQTFTFRIPPDK